MINYCDIYDIEYGDLAEDVKYVLNFISTDSEVLDVGCGTGRVTKHLLDHGIKKITGIDLSSEEVHRFNLIYNKYNVRAYNKDVAEHNGKNQYDIVLFLFNGMMYLTSETDHNKVLHNIYKNLKFGGLFIFCVYKFDTSIMLECDDAWRKTKEIVTNDLLIHKYVSAKYCSDSSIMNRTFRYTFDDDSNQEIDKHFSIIYKDKYYYSNLLSRNGFKIIRTDDQIQGYPSLKDYIFFVAQK